MKDKLEKVTLFEGRHMRLVRKGKWEYVERVRVTGVVGILAVTDDQKLVLTEQFRIPVGKSVIELPAGLAGDIAGEEEEALATAATRELFEETGYQAGEMTLLTTGPSSAGLTNETIALFRARQLRKVNAGGGDGSESIVVHEIPLAHVHQWLDEQAQAGLLIDPKVYAGLYFVK